MIFWVVCADGDGLSKSLSSCDERALKTKEVSYGGLQASVMEGEEIKVVERCNRERIPPLKANGSNL